MSKLLLFFEFDKENKAVSREQHRYDVGQGGSMGIGWVLAQGSALCAPAPFSIVSKPIW